MAKHTVSKKLQEYFRDNPNSDVKAVATLFGVNTHQAKYARDKVLPNNSNKVECKTQNPCKETKGPHHNGPLVHTERTLDSQLAIRKMRGQDPLFSTDQVIYLLQIASDEAKYLIDQTP